MACPGACDGLARVIRPHTSVRCASACLYATAAVTTSPRRCVVRCAVSAAVVHASWNGGGSMRGGGAKPWLARGRAMAWPLVLREEARGRLIATVPRGRVIIRAARLCARGRLGDEHGRWAGEAPRAQCQEGGHIASCGAAALHARDSCAGSIGHYHPLSHARSRARSSTSARAPWQADTARTTARPPYLLERVRLLAPARAAAAAAAAGSSSNGAAACRRCYCCSAHMNPDSYELAESSYPAGYELFGSSYELGFISRGYESGKKASYEPIRIMTNLKVHMRH